VSWTARLRSAKSQYQSLRLTPDDDNTLDTRGFAYLKSGEFDKAIADYDAALKIDPQRAASLYCRGLAKNKKGDSVGGDADIAAAIAIKADIAEEYAGYGVK
jgi:tetratricopeptide (TPR) repeat protein